MTPPLPRLHAVTNDRIIARAGFSRRAGNIAQASAVALHLRAPASPGGRLVEVALTLKRVCDRSGSPFFVNDRADVLRAISGHSKELALAARSRSDTRASLPSCSRSSPLTDTHSSAFS